MGFFLFITKYNYCKWIAQQYIYLKVVFILQCLTQKTISDSLTMAKKET